MSNIITEAIRPMNGCARCVWWKKGTKDNWGYCRVNRAKYWWQAPPCPEYERDPTVPDSIDLIPYEE